MVASGFSSMYDAASSSYCLLNGLLMWVQTVMVPPGAAVSSSSPEEEQPAANRASAAAPTARVRAVLMLPPRSGRPGGIQVDHCGQVSGLVGVEPLGQRAFERQQLQG